MALTFGTLLSSQGTDAHVPRPIARPFSVAVISTVHRAPQRSDLGGPSGGFPGPAARSVLARCRENSTRAPEGVHGGSRTAGPGPRSASRRGSGTRLAQALGSTGRRPLGARAGSGDAAGPELDAHPGAHGLGRLGDAVLPRPLAGATHDDEVPVSQREAQALPTAHGAQQKRAG